MKYITIGALLFLVALVAFLPSSPLKIKGQVKDAQGNAIAYTSIAEKGTGNIVQADEVGAFSITVKKAEAVLVFSAIGFETKEVKLSGKLFIDVELKNVVQKLEEVVVTAYAPVRKKSVTGAVVQMENHSIAEPSQQLSGRAAGVFIQATKLRADDKNLPDEYYDTEEKEFNTEDYDGITENKFLAVKDNPLSTFSIDVDAASYSNVRRFLNQGQLPPAGAVRIEEMINYFHYEYAQPKGDDPFAIHTEMAETPWNKDHRLMLVSMQGKKIPVDNLPASNLVFLIDVSGSMEDDNKLPLVKQSLKLLADQLREQDKVAIVVYAGSAGMVLPATNGAHKQSIKDAVERLAAGGSTAGGAGIQLAYKIARQNLIPGGNNRIILCTDGDFNVGMSSDDEMERLIEKERESGVFLTVLGYGMGNYKDNKMQKLADKGNGNHAYIDNLSEAKKVLVHEFGGTLFTIAKDVKLQIEFNPSKVQAYRLIGYENRMLRSEDFNNDKKDAGELGSGHTVTALYEIIPTGIKSDFVEKIDPLKYQAAPLTNNTSGEWTTIKFRYKEPQGSVSKLLMKTVTDNNSSIGNTSDNFRFAAAVAEFGMLLRNSSFKQASSYNHVLALANGATGNDTEGYRKEFIQLVQKAGGIVAAHPVKNEEELVGIK